MAGLVCMRELRMIAFAAHFDQPSAVNRLMMFVLFICVVIHNTHVYTRYCDGAVTVSLRG